MHYGCECGDHAPIYRLMFVVPFTDGAKNVPHALSAPSTADDECSQRSQRRMTNMINSFCCEASLQCSPKPPVVDIAHADEVCARGHDSTTRSGFLMIRPG